MVDKNLVDFCVKEALILQGKCLALLDEKKDVVSKVEEAKIYLKKQPEYVKFLQHLQTELHQKNIGAFSELLSYFVRDVLQKEKDIVFDLYTYHNLPALKIEASNNGHRENIYEGNGGSIANIVSTGLRLIALSRLNHRKFIILDEPDCWLKPEHVPLFAKIIGEISASLNIQTIIISHHHWEYFKDYGRVLELKQEGFLLTTNIIHDTPIMEQTKKFDVIEKIILSRFMSHYDTTFELHPHLTCLIGENDIGKSVLATAMKALSYADSSDSYIMHNEKEARVFVELTGKRQILWQRFLETNQENTQKVKYSIFIDGQLEGASEYSAHETPERVAKLLNICTTEDIDVHIGNQKQPVFLLSGDVKPHQRAKILSLGKESLLIQRMMENIKSKKRQSKQTETEGEKRYAVIEKSLAVLDNIDDLVQRSESSKDNLLQLEKDEDILLSLKSTIEVLDEIETIASTDKIHTTYIEEPILHPVHDLLNFIHEYEKIELIANQSLIDLSHQLEEINPVASLKEAIEQIELSEQLSQIETVKPLDDIEALISTASIEKAIQMLSEVEQFSQLNLIHYDLTIPDIRPPVELLELIEEMETNENLSEELLKKDTVIQQWRAKLKQEDQEYLEKYGAVCPTCQQPITETHLQGHH